MIPVGESIPWGVAVGVDRGAHLAIAASARAAAATVRPWAAAGGNGGGGNVTINIHGVIDKQGAAREIHQIMRDYKRKGGNAPLGIA